MRRERSRVSAGSMADIAFLLLVFFLLVTKINQKQGIFHEMPEPTQEGGGVTDERDLILVQLGSQGEMLVREKEASLEDLAAHVRHFYMNSGVLEELHPQPDYPERSWAEHKAEANETRRFQLAVTKDMLGAFRELPERSGILIKSRDDTPYDWYVEVLDAIDAVRNQCRDNLTREISGKTLADLNPRMREDQEIMMAVKLVFPNKVSDHWE